MSQQQAFQAQLLASDSKSQPMILRLQVLTKAQRLKRAITFGALSLLVSLLMIGVPFLHFFLVPLGLIFTVIITQRVYTTKQYIHSGEGECPYCGKKVLVHKRAFKLPFADVCEHCHRALSIAA